VMKHIGINRIKFHLHQLKRAALSFCIKGVFNEKSFDSFIFNSSLSGL
jgi:hypothetical protein